MCLEQENVVAFPREGFIIGSHHCRAPGHERHLICLLGRDHDGDHVFTTWEGCRMRYGARTVPFAGFVNG